MPEKLEDNKPYRFTERIEPELICHCHGEVIIRLVLTRHVKVEYSLDPNSPVGGRGRGGSMEIVSPILEFTTFCKNCALRYDLEHIEEMRGTKIINKLMEKYTKKYGLKFKE